MPGRRPLAALGLLLLAGCGSSGVSLSAPTPGGAVATDCRALVAALPADLVPKQTPRSVHPASPYTAAFGSPAVTVRCGAPLGSFDPTAQVETVDGVDWLLVSSGGSAEHYVAWRSPTLLSVVIPHAYLPADVLPALSPLVARYGVTAYPTGS